ncbi:MAG: L-lactate dehydrogenase [Sporolactobacillus sp.]
MKHLRKYAIIGVGNVGAAVAYTLVTKGIADELVIIDKNELLARAEQLDLQDMQGRVDTRTRIKINDYHELADADILFITAGNIHAYEEESAAGDRWAEFKYTKEIVKDIAPKVKASGFHGVVIDTMNPCDAITQYFQENTGLSRRQVLATGTFLDTARMQKVVSDQFNCDPKNVTGYVYGEHGESQFAAWSTVQVNGRPIVELAKQQQINLVDLEEAARRGGWEVYTGKHYTNWAIATCAVKLSQAVLSDARAAYICSCFSEKYGTYVGQPAIVGKHGVEEVTVLPLTEEEEARFKHSADTIKEKFQMFEKK